jgi:hypothetical protein
VGARIVVSLDGVIVTEVQLTKPVTVVGRHPTCDIRIDHPAVSGRHMLFRSVNRTMYAEDLASTNGMKVNGLSTQHQVVHHLDMIEVGTHRLHFFDEDLLGPKGLDSLEDTVHTDYERTMMAAHVAPAAEPAPAKEDFSRTMAIERDQTLRLGPRGSAVAQEIQPLALRVVEGERSGETIALVQANTMLGTMGGDSALVVRRNNGYFVVRFGGNRPPRVNDREVGSGAQQLSPHDRIEVGYQRYEVIPAAP